MKDDYILSICIPTYNRCDALEECLNTIVSDPAFSKDIEIIISDNCSTDNTELLVSRYVNKYYNIKYYRNDYNTGADRNVLLSLEHGTGQYLKLLNDYSIFLPGGLAFLLKCIKDNFENKPVIYISRKLVPGKEHISITSLDELLSVEQWGLSWIGNYGYWKDDFSSFEAKDRRIDTMFLQVDWLIRSFKIKKEIAYYSHPITWRRPFKTKQGGYNFFKIHTESYFVQFQELVDKGELKESSLELAKKDVLRGLMYWVIVLRFDKKHFSYESTDQFRILKEQFGKYKWFYPVALRGTLGAFKQLFMEGFVIPKYRKFIKPIVKYKRK